MHSTAHGAECIDALFSTAFAKACRRIDTGSTGLTLLSVSVLLDFQHVVHAEVNVAGAGDTAHLLGAADADDRAGPSGSGGGIGQNHSRAGPVRLAGCG